MEKKHFCRECLAVCADEQLAKLLGCSQFFGRNGDPFKVLGIMKLESGESGLIVEYIEKGMRMHSFLKINENLPKIIQWLENKRIEDLEKEMIKFHLFRTDLQKKGFYNPDLSERAKKLVSVYI